MRQTCFAMCLIAAACAAGADEPVNTSQSAPATQAAPTVSLLPELLPQAKPLVEPIAGGEIDWTHGQIIAIGEGKAQGASGQQVDMAKRGAYLAAARNAALMLGGIRIGPGGRFTDIDRATVKVEAVLKDFKEVSSDFDPRTRTATVKLAVPIYGAKGIVKVMDLRPGSLVEMAKRTSQKTSGVKLIVIDARGTGFKPCLLPRVINSSGKALFDAATSPAYKESSAQPAVYVTAPAPESQPGSAAASTRLVEKRQGVVLVRATASPDNSSGTIVLDEYDGDILLAISGLLDQGRVVVIADQADTGAASAPASK